ncbi:MAG: AAA family ATPase [Gemmatimonadaceae bacterium]
MPSRSCGARADSTLAAKFQSVSQTTLARLVILFLNGAFGIGKTAVARALRRRFPRSLVFDPEKIGGPLQLAARIVGREADDFQDLRTWRQLTIVGLRIARAVSPTVIVPMAFSDWGYLEEVRSGAEGFDRRVHHFCLIAPLAVVQQRLHARGADPVSHPWEYRRAAECCAAHQDQRFVRHIDATAGTPDQLAAEIANATQSS